MWLWTARNRYGKNPLIDWAITSTKGLALTGKREISSSRNLRKSLKNTTFGSRVTWPDVPEGLINALFFLDIILFIDSNGGGWHFTSFLIRDSKAAAKEGWLLLRSSRTRPR
jgi:hypothetical protein